MSAEVERSLADVVAAQAAATGPVPWVESARDDRVVDRNRLAVTTARWLALGVEGHRVGLLTDDPVAFAALFVSLVGARATVVPLDPRAPDESVRAMVDLARVELTVTTLRDAPGLGGPLVTVSDPDWTPAQPLPGPTVGRPGAPSVADRPATEGGCVLFSSGSTGPRKAIGLGEAQLLHVARGVARAYELGPGDRGFNPLPLTHVNGEVVGLLAPLVSGGTVVLDDRFHRTGFWALVARRRATWVNAVPSIITILARLPAQTEECPHPGAPTTVRFVRSASAPLSEAVLTRFEDRYGIPVVESYGMTEAASQITANPVGGRRPGTVGVPVDIELKVVADDGTVAPTGSVGRVAIRGDGVIRAYENGVGTERFDPDGWLDTGDLGSLDAHGFLTLAGREGDVINRGGVKVFPREVEEVLLAHPAVSEAVVVGRVDDVLGQVPVAYVVAAPDAPDDLPAQLTARSQAALPRAHRPVDVVLMDEVPLGPTGKPVRRFVADLDRDAVSTGMRS